MVSLDIWRISELFDDIIQGRGIKRSVHTLEYDKATYSELFIERLQVNKYRPMSLHKIPLDADVKVPAFYIHKNLALFGYVQWMKHDADIAIKTWSSSEINSIGLSKYVLANDTSKVVFVNTDLVERLEE
jgi:hypothetical protein